MSTFPAFLRRRPLLSYWVLTFAISWGLVLLVIGGPDGIPSSFEENTRLLPLGIAAMLAGPSIAGIFLTGITSGTFGFRHLLARLRTWRVGLRWYALALCFAPLLALGILLPLSLISANYVPGIFATSDRTALLQLGVLGGLCAGIFEELGWTGFAIPRVRQHHPAVRTGLIVGAFWGAWHLLVNFWGGGTPSGTLSLELLIPALLVSVAVLPPYRVLMVWLYDRTGSLLLAMLMHMSLTSSMLILQPLQPGMPRSTYFLLFSAGLWGLVAAMARAGRGQLVPEQTWRRAA